MSLEPLAKASVDLVDDRGVRRGTVEIRDRSTVASIQILDDADEDLLEERVQLLESRVYEYVLRDVGPTEQLLESEVIQPSRVSPSAGRIEPGLATGLLPLTLVDNVGRVTARGAVEVRTYKIDYRTDYKVMLDFIADQATSLLLEFRAPSFLRLAIDPHADTETIHQRLVVLMSLLRSSELVNAIELITSSPHRRWTTELEKRDSRRASFSRSMALREIAAGSNRVSLPVDHPLYRRLASLGVDQPSLPTQMTRIHGSDSLDTAENRFVKHALQDFETVLGQVAGILRDEKSPASRRLIRETESALERIRAWLAHDLFAHVSAAVNIPVQSPVLQKRSGYREVLRAWLMFQLALQLDWRGGSEVFAAGKRNVASLYEYWVFFQLLDLVRSVFRLEDPSPVLMELTEDGIDLRLRSGRHLAFRGRYSADAQDLRIQFSYNRTFSRRGDPDSPENYPFPGSWTRPMRPDFTLSLWPAEFSEEEAERQELLVHVHFDAKYRVEDVVGLFGTGNEDEVEEDDRPAEPGRPAKRSDLLKMHAYRDAIRRTEGAYVIYPGVRGPQLQEWFAFHEILPGMGAFALKPGSEASTIENLRTFLADIANHVCKRSSRMEQQTYHTFRVQEPSEAYRPSTALPEEDQMHRRLRPQPPLEIENQ